jgi:D-lactate dehydrogenase
MFARNWMKTLVYSARPYDTEALKAVGGLHSLTFTEQRLSENTVNLASGFDTAALFTSDDASASVLERLYAVGVRHLALRSAGYDHVDLVRAKTLEMKVANVPAYSPYAVAEHAVAMLLAVNRKIIEGQLLMYMQDFRLDSLVGFDVHGKTVGVVGTGKIGFAFSKIMNGFGAKIIAFDPVQNAEAVAMGVQYVSFESLLKNSDIVSIHCPLNDNTRHLFSRTEFSIIKKECILINTSRGPVVNTSDLLDAIESKAIGAACLDVYEFEKGLYFSDHQNDVLHDKYFNRLRSFKNVLLTGHQGFLTREAIQGIAETTIRNLDLWQNNQLNPNSLI